jgi:hypothetical protein
MHPKDDLLRALVDQELSGKQTDQIQEHLRRCPNCAGRLVAIQARAKAVSSSLDQLAPTARELPRSPQTAYRQFSKIQKENPFTMFTKKSFWASLGVVAMLVLALSFTPVRAWASSLLGLFRVQQVTVISFDPQAAQESRGNLSGSEAAIRQLFKDNLEIIEQGELRALTASDDPTQAAGFSPRLLVADSSQPAQLYVKPGMRANFTIDQPTLQALIDSAGVDVQIPASMNGEVVTLDVPAALAAVYGDCPLMDKGLDTPPSGCTSLLQMPSPSVSAPEGLDVVKMGEAMLQFLGYSPSEARSMSQRIDWTTTLILPIPQGEGISYEDVSVDGVAGTFLSHGEGEQYMLVWVKNGILYGLQGEGSLEDAQALVATLN